MSTQTQATREPSPVDAPKYARERNMSLGAAFRVFVAQLPPKLLMAGLGLTLAARLWLGNFGLWDLAPLVLIFVLHPFAEWLIHVYILHFRPRTVAGIEVDLHAAKHHRAHHIDPWDLRYVVMPLPAILVGTLVAVPTAWLVFPTIEVAATALLVVSATALTYEWAHFLTHTSYRPRGRIYKRIYKFHRLHHFKNETYWMGVSRHFGDTVLGTMKQAAEVETSPTARNLLADARATTSTENGD